MAKLPRHWTDQAIEDAVSKRREELLAQINAGLDKHLRNEYGRIMVSPSVLQGNIENGDHLMREFVKALVAVGTEYDRYEAESPEGDPLRRSPREAYGHHYSKIPDITEQVRRWQEAAEDKLNDKALLDAVGAGRFAKLPSGAEFWTVVPSPRLDKGGYWAVCRRLANDLQNQNPDGHFRTFSRSPVELIEQYGGLIPHTAHALMMAYASGHFGDFLVIPIQLGKDWYGASARHVRVNLRQDEFCLDPLTMLATVWMTPGLLSSGAHSLLITGSTFTFPRGEVNHYQPHPQCMKLTVCGYRVYSANMAFEPEQGSSSVVPTGFLSQ